jgi:hypothetical protein
MVGFNIGRGSLRNSASWRVLLTISAYRSDLRCFGVRTLPLRNRSLAIDGAEAHPVGHSSLLTPTEPRLIGGARQARLSVARLAATIDGSAAFHSSESCGTSGYPGAIDSFGNLTLINSAFSGNSVPDAGGAISVDAPSSGTVKNSILADSTGGNCSGPITDARLQHLGR